MVAAGQLRWFDSVPITKRNLPAKVWRTFFWRLKRFQHSWLFCFISDQFSFILIWTQIDTAEFFFPDVFFQLNSAVAIDTFSKEAFISSAKINFPSRFCLFKNTMADDDRQFNQSAQPEAEPAAIVQSDDANEKRNMIGFWIVGLCNTYGSTVLLSAAYDIIKQLNGLSVRKLNENWLKKLWEKINTPFELGWWAFSE